MSGRALNIIVTALIAGAAVPVYGAQAEPTEIEYSREGDGIVLTFTGALQESHDAVNWTPLDATSPYKAYFANGTRFYRSVETEETITTWTAYCSPWVTMELNWCPPGTFTMGSPTTELGRFPSEIQHKVTLTKGYWIGKYEVTQAQYSAVTGANPSAFRGNSLPVEQVTWDNAVAFCDRLTSKEKAAGRLPDGYKFALPTEAQWEYACRAGTTTALNSGKDLSNADKCAEMDEVGWYSNNASYQTHPVGQKKVNSWGLYDMHGNVAEWCRDWMGDYTAADVVDPTGPATGMLRVTRGGNWLDTAGGCRSAFHYSCEYPTTYQKNLGFRVVLLPADTQTSSAD